MRGNLTARCAHMQQPLLLFIRRLFGSLRTTRVAGKNESKHPDGGQKKHDRPRVMLPSPCIYSPGSQPGQSQEDIPCNPQKPVHYKLPADQWHNLHFYYNFITIINTASKIF